MKNRLLWLIYLAHIRIVSHTWHVSRRYEGSQSMSTTMSLVIGYCLCEPINMPYGIGYSSCPSINVSHVIGYSSCIPTRISCVISHTSCLPITKSCMNGYFSCEPFTVSNGIGYSSCLPVTILCTTALFTLFLQNDETNYVKVFIQCLWTLNICAWF